MRENIRIAKEFLLKAQARDGGWPYRLGAQSSPEPTCYSLLALSGNRENGTATPSAVHHQASALERGLQWLESRVNAQGAVMLEGDDGPHWSTSLLVLTLARLRQAEPLRDRSVQFMLSWYGNQLELKDEVTLDSQLRGWPWISDTFSWVEPTSYAILALKLSGDGNHPRVAEAERLLLDRVCTDGGWNYGNRVVLGRQLVAFVPPTAIATLALQNVSAARQPIEQSVAFLRRELGYAQSTLSLALVILCFHALGQPTEEYVNALLNRQKPDGSWRQAVHLTALSILALECEAGGTNVFKL